MCKILVALGILAILDFGQGENAKFVPGRFRRDVDNLPAEKDAQTIFTIKESIARLRHAETRLKTLNDLVEEGIANGALAKSLGTVQSQVEKGAVDYSKIISIFKDTAPKTFKEVIKRISDDTHILLDQLHGRLDSLGNLFKDVKHDSDDTSAEEHHAQKSK
ncbi:unnamed protein product [Allacma fusca]|uniref:Uncharacterized protein n=1 Tax=Allacma fusca TaxID=39272 RepID=A0A8J2NW28_9HEXA|nr:unnamed protein product [Allacma fusca]